MKYIQILSLLLLFSACETEESESRSAMLMEVADEEHMEFGAFEENAEYSIPITAQPSPFDFSDHRIIKHGTLKFQTDSLNKTVDMIKRETARFGGYVASESEFEFDTKFNNSLRIRIPANKFDLFLSTISLGVDKFDRKDISTRDITEEFLDLQTRIENKKKLEQRYLEILKKADSVKDILSVESETGKIREEIESMEGRLKFLHNKSELSTLEITCYEVFPSTISKQTTFIAKLKAGLTNGIDLFKYLIIALVNIWPLIILGVAGFWFYKTRSRNKKILEVS